MSFLVAGLVGGYKASEMPGPLAPRDVVELAYLTARRRIDPASAEDVAQETWVKYRIQAEREGPTWLEARARAWVRCVAANAARSLWRKRRLTEEVEVASSADDPALRAAREEAQELDRALARRVLAGLDRADRRLLALRVLEGLSWDEVAQVLDERPSTLRSRYTRLRQRLQERWGEETP